MPSELSPSLARKILTALSTHGLPPERGLHFINVGTEPYLKVIEQEYLDLLLPEGGASFKLVHGFHGGGKTHFLMCLRELAWQRGFAVSHVTLSPAKTPFHDGRAVYRAVVENLLGKPASDEEVPGSTGLPDLLRGVIEARLEAHGEKAVRTWLLRTVRNLPVDSQSLRSAVSGFGLAYLDDDLDRQDLLGAWLLGKEVPVSGHRALGVFESVTQANAFGLLRALAQLLRGLGFAGTLFMFDEAERLASIRGQARDRQMGNLRELVDLCGRGALPGVLCAYAVTPDSFNEVVQDYPALQQRLATPAPLSVRHPLSPLVDLENLDLASEALLKGMGERILHVFEVARGVTLNGALQRENLSRFAELTAQTSFGSQARRLFVRAFLGLLFDQQAQGERSITEGEIEARLKQGITDLKSLEEAALAAARPEGDFGDELPEGDLEDFGEEGDDDRFGESFGDEALPEEEPPTRRRKRTP